MSTTDMGGLAVGRDTTSRSSEFAFQYMLVRSIRVTRELSVVLILLTLAVAWVLGYRFNDANNGLKHLYYVPIVLAVTRFGWAGAVSVGLVAGVLAGPMDPPLTTAEWTGLQAWLVRSFFFVSIGVLVAWLVRGSYEAKSASFEDTVVSRRFLTALARGDIELQYQPIADTSSDRIVAVEALSRWRDPERGLLSPAQFIGPLERTGSITALDRWVLRAALQQARIWADARLPVSVTVNVSATRFDQRDLVDDVRESLQATAVHADALEIEITESAVIGDVAAAQVQIDALRAIGVRVAIDDFGVGYSSIGYLLDLHVDTVKIDRSLVEHVADDPRTARVLEALGYLFKGLGLSIVAEGVEDAEQYSRLRAAGYDRVQGYYVGRPSTPENITTLLRAGGF